MIKFLVPPLGKALAVAASTVALVLAARAVAPSPTTTTTTTAPPATVELSPVITDPTTSTTLPPAILPDGTPQPREGTTYDGQPCDTLAPYWAINPTNGQKIGGSQCMLLDAGFAQDELHAGQVEP